MAVSRSLGFWVPKPKTFLGLMSLPTGTEIISLAMLFNKLTGLYGLLAIVTGYAVNAVQLSMFIYSVLALIALAFLFPHIRRQSPFHALALAWLYIIDALVNTAYIANFAVVWYVATASPNGGAAYTPQGPEMTKNAGGGTAAARRAENGTGREGVSANGTAPSHGGGSRAAAQAQDTASSIVLIVFFSLVRVYLCLVVMSFARQVLMRHMESRATDVASKVDSPFAEGTPEGEGWKGKLGRVMVSIGNSYWVPSIEEEQAEEEGGDGDDEWTRDVSSKIRSRGRRYGTAPLRSDAEGSERD
ncbi:hypothetical protein NKR23_g4617 [Pleurostoma richardsiae]|uniref:Inositolphosphorylceramide synthase subunit Kei1-domain-containing protein n=1 Tax=Pleurostoma richardsiae TaxID=41990 RepID=A0AA38VRR2_9PEZI|nr:hypothetical protein NKR23_g4617 [Pleurostoma richardsiae]